MSRISNIGGGGSGGGGGGGVTSFAKQGSTPLIGAVTISAGSNVTLTQSGQNIVIASSGGGGGGSVTSVSGTTDRITISGTATDPIVDIAATYVGQTSITTLGTIATGTWSATTIAVNKGGTGQTSYTDGQLLIGNTSGNTLTKATLTGTSNQVIVTNGNGTITLSTPQSIGTGSSPTFAGMTIASGNITFTKTFGVRWADDNDAIIVSDNPAWSSSKDNTMTFRVYGLASTNGAFTFVEAIGSTVLLSIDANNGLLTHSGNSLHSGYLRVGSTSAPSNTTAGDLTFVRGFATSIALTGAITGSTGYNGLVVTADTGVVTTGTWSATTIAVNKGGTGQTTYTDGQLLIGNTSGNTLAKATLTGTSNRLSVTNGNGSITLDIDSNYVGQATITTLGTVATGTWSATTIAVNKGGTGQTSYTDGQLLIGNTTGNTLAKATLTGTANQVVVTNGSGTITLSTPQDIAAASTPTFGGMTNNGNEVIAGYLRVGSTSAPSNTTAGDLTAVRLNVGNTGAFSASNGEFVSIAGTMTDTSSPSAFMSVSPTAAPASNSSAAFQGLNFIMSMNGSGTFTSTTAGTGVNMAVNALSSGTITGLIGLACIGVQFPNSGSAVTMTVTNVTAVSAYMANVVAGSATTTATVTTAIGYDIPFGVIGNSIFTITTLIGYRMQDILATGSTITTFTGMRIAKLTKGTTNNYGIQVAQPGIANTTGATTDSIALQVATASVAMGNTTNTTTTAESVYLGIQTYTSTTNTRTITNAHTLYIEGAPVASTNVTFTNTAYALFVDAGPVRIDATTANGLVATVLGSVGPTGASTTVQEWFTLTINGTVRYIPCF